jgi:hypothetical protein
MKTTIFITPSVMEGNTNFKHLRKIKHTHYPADDAKGNAEAF